MPPTTTARAQQRRDALQTANERRIHAGQVRRLVRDGKLGVLDVIDGDLPADLADGAATLKLEALLQAAERVGPTVCRRILAVAQLDGYRRLGDLAGRPQARERLAAAFDRFAPPVAVRRRPVRASRRRPA